MRIILLAFVSLLMGSALMGGDLKVSGDTFFHFAFEELDKNEFQLNRAYFTFQNKVSDNISYKFQTDIGAGGATDYSVYLKNAKFDWKTDLGKFTFGLQGMNMFKVQENTWGYRFIEKSPMDKNKFSSSADLGIGWDRSFGDLSTSMLITNGTGYKKVEDDQYKKVSTRLLYGKSKLKQGFNAGVVFSYEPEDYSTIEGADTSISKGNTTVIGGFGGVAFSQLKLGVEYAVHTLSTSTSTAQSIFSIYGDYKILEDLSGFGRLDVLNSDSDAQNDGSKTVILGANYMPEKALSIAPNVIMTIPQEGDSETTYRVSFRFKI